MRGGSALSSRQDQPGSLASRSDTYETETPVLIYTLGAARGLIFLKDTGEKGLWGKKCREEVEVFEEVQALDNSLFCMTGPINEACLHLVPVEKSAGRAEELRFGITARVAQRLMVNLLLGEYKLYRKAGWSQHLPLPAGDRGQKRARDEDEGDGAADSSSASLAQPNSSSATTEPPVAPGAAPAARPDWLLSSAFAEHGADFPSTRVLALLAMASRSHRDFARAAMERVQRFQTILLVQGPELALAKLSGTKVVENRSFKLQLPAWVALKVGNNKKWRSIKWPEALRAPIAALPDDPKCSDWYGKVVGFVRLTEDRTAAQCNGYRWANPGSHCYVIEAAITLKQPVPIAPHGPATKWAANEEERQSILAQLHGPPTYHDLEPLSAHLGASSTEGSTGPAPAAEPQEARAKQGRKTLPGQPKTALGQLETPRRIKRVVEEEFPHGRILVCGGESTVGGAGET